MIPELDEDLVKHSASVNSAQFYDLLKEHRKSVLFKKLF